MSIKNKKNLTNNAILINFQKVKFIMKFNNLQYICNKFFCNIISDYNSYISSPTYYNIFFLTFNLVRILLRSSKFYIFILITK